MSFAIVYIHQPSHAAGYIGLVSVYLPGLRQEVFAEFGDGVLVGHTCDVIADHTLRLFPFIKHGEVFFRQKLNVVFVESKSCRIIALPSLPHPWQLDLCIHDRT